jgi:hypothetical protein
MSSLFAAVLLLTAAAEARPAKKVSRDPRTAGLGKNCQRSGDCKHKSQRCLKESDANGKPLDKGFCVLPCASYEAGTAKMVPGATVAPVQKRKKPPPPRCPPKYQCRSAGSGVPIDMCVRE